MIRMDQLSEDEIRRYLKPQTHWTAIVGPLLAIASVVGGGIWWAARAPDPADFKKTQSDIVEIRIDGASTKKDVQGLRNDFSEFKLDIKQALQQRRK